MVRKTETVTLKSESRYYLNFMNYANFKERQKT